MTATIAFETVGQRFTQLIMNLGISKNAFAASLGKTATVIQHLVDERNKPGFDLLLLVFETYPNVSKDWLLQGVGPMLKNGSTTSLSSGAAADQSQTVAGITKVEADTAAPPDSIPTPAGHSTVALSGVMAAAPAASTKNVAVDASEASASSAATAIAAAPAATAPVAPAPAVTPDASWQTTLYTQQMAHQLALSELRNQHLQDQQRLMQQMLDLMQRRM